MFRISFATFLLFWSLNLPVFAKITNITSDNYLLVKDLIQEIRQKDKDAPILLVSDFDNTLMKPINILGSDQFYEWQAHLIKTNSPKKDFATFDEFMDVHAKAMGLTNMDLTDPLIPSFLNTLNQQNVKMVVLTSRGPFFRTLTSRDLKKNQIDIASLSPFPNYNYQGQINGRDIHFQDGIFSTSGLNKGEALFFLLNENKAHFPYIIFIDDMEKHTIAVSEYVSKNPELDKKVDVTAIRYSKEDLAKAMFLKNEKKAKKEITAFKKFLKKHFP